ncbi:Protein prenyltransferase alpha subunit repeat-containing protein 1-B [Trichoplax sp. H2]|nr:Protein prenyltransferase alpha subunit repeat-containing protein 1-B [Trichoplax sp. H2]|eukprot:RDD43724.1 Protein prenyltransferase alpha subunit repeat-containing protein 1-B [Trichoplax sp. H2]
MEGEKGYTELVKILNSQECIEELGIVHGSDNDLIFIDGKLGISSGLGKKIYVFVHKEFFKVRSSSSDLNDCDLVIASLSMVLLLFNPECYTAWNARKELITSEKIFIADEFRIMNLILTCYPRSAELFSHRRWLIQHAAKIGDCDIKTLCKLELTVAAKTADQYYSNYISWSHRCWILCTYLANYQEILLSELQDTALWLQMHVSDSNVYYYRQQLLTLLVQLNQVNVKKLWVSELQVNRELIEFYVGHESMWLFRRFLLANIPVNNEEKKNLCHQEMEFVNESCLVKESTDLTFGPNRQIHFAKEYKIFISFMISTLDNS